MRQLRVLVVHPDPEEAGRIAQVARKLGHDPLVVPDGERAIDRFIQSPADVIVIELVLPGRDGGTTVESVRWAPGGDRVAVFLLGTRGTMPDRLEAVGRRVRAHATLPGALNEVVLESLLAGVAGPSTQPTRIGSVDPLSPDTPVIDSLMASTDERLHPSASDAIDDVSTDQKLDPESRSGPWPVSGAQIHDAGVRADRRIPTPGQAPDPTAFDEELYTDVDDELLGEWSLGSDPGAEQEGRVVDGWARATEDTEDGVQGDLADTPLPRLLNRLAEMRATGGLIVTALADARRTTTGESPKKVVYFRNGVPTYVQSNLVQECLGQVLARGGHIGVDVLDESIRRMSRGEGRQGAVLIRMGAIDAHQLREALEDQLRVKLFDLFAWQRGLYRFNERMVPPAETVTLEMSLSEIVLQGVVHRVPPQRLLSALSPHLDRYVVPELSKMAAFRNLDMPPQTRALLHGIDGTAMLRNLLGRAGERPGAAAQLLFSLYCTDAIHFAELPLPSQRLPVDDEPPKTGLPRLGAGTADVAALREELGRLGRLLRAEQYAEALGTDDEGSARRQAQALAERFRPLTEGAGPRDLRALAFEVCARLVHASEALSNAPRSPTVVAKRRMNELAEAFSDIPTADQKRNRAVEPIDPFADQVTTSPIPGDTSEPSDAPVPSDEERLTDPDPRRVTGAIDLPSSADDLAVSAEPDPSTIDEDVEEDFPTQEDDSGLIVPHDDIDPDRTFDARLTVPEDARSTAPPGPEVDGGRRIRVDPIGGPTVESPLSGEQLDARVEAIARAERSFRRGERALDRGRYDDAVEAFQRSVELCPDEGEFLAYLAFSRFRRDAAGPVAIETLEKACSLAPKLDTPHLLLARVLSEQGDDAGARNAYERALAANPDCREALDALRTSP